VLVGVVDGGLAIVSNQTRTDTLSGPWPLGTRVIFLRGLRLPDRIRVPFDGNAARLIRENQIANNPERAMAETPWTGVPIP
jgi:hypothetical protein